MSDTSITPTPADVGTAIAPAATTQPVPFPSAPAFSSAGIPTDPVAKHELACALRRAAALLSTCHILILHTGAGWSADSGLPVYRDVADLPAMKQRGLKYRDICDPAWLFTDPALFLGFWGKCFNDYRHTQPHAGYDIIRTWKETRHHPHTPAAALIRAEMQRLRKQQKQAKKAGTKEWWEYEQPHTDVVEDYDRNNNTQCHGTREEQREAETKELVTRELTSLCSTSETLEHSQQAQQIQTGPQTILKLPTDSRPVQLPSTQPTSSTTADRTGDGDDSSNRMMDDDDSSDDDNEEDDGRPLSAVCSFFSFTSNVDAHFHRAGFTPAELYECHGNSERWQCAELCSFDTWKAPAAFRFIVQPDTLCAHKHTPPRLSTLYNNTRSNNDSDDDDDDSNDEDDDELMALHGWTPTSSFATNHPVCPLGHPARPNILMFHDHHWLPDKQAQDHYHLWLHAVLNLATQYPALNIVILEVGCGTNVQTVRWRSESIYQMMKHSTTTTTATSTAQHNNNTTTHESNNSNSNSGKGSKRGRRALIRVNLSESEIMMNGKDEDCLSIGCSGLVAIQIIDRLITQQQQQQQKQQQQQQQPTQTPQVYTDKECQ